MRFSRCTRIVSSSPSVRPNASANFKMAFTTMLSCGPTSKGASPSKLRVVSFTASPVPGMIFMRSTSCSISACIVVDTSWYPSSRTPLTFRYRFTFAGATSLSEPIPANSRASTSWATRAMSSMSTDPSNVSRETFCFSSCCITAAPFVSFDAL